MVFRGSHSIVPGEPTIAARRVFAGAQILEPRLLARIPEGPGDIVTVLYEPLLREGSLVHALTSRRKWFDLGTPERLREAGVVVVLVDLARAATFGAADRSDAGR